MDIKEADRTVIAKPIAWRPKISNFKSFSELLAGSTNGSPSSKPTITAIRPRTVRFNPVMSSPPVELVSSQAEFTGTEPCHLSDKIMKSDHTPPSLYKPLAKTVSRTAISLLANMGTCNASHEQALARNLASPSEMVEVINLPKSTPMQSGNDKNPQLSANNSDRPFYDGYNWRKYGQKQVKGSEHPRSYYKCTHPNCLVKKKVERTMDGEVAEIVYKGEHNHSKPRLPRRHAFDGSSEPSNHQFLNNQLIDDEVHESSSHLKNLVKTQEFHNHDSSEACDASIPTLDCLFGVARVHDGSKVITETADDVLTSKRRKGLCKLKETRSEGLQEPRVVHDGSDSEAISDGFRWRKYGQKVVKGNPYPRSYYKCTGVKCNVRKHVERALDDPTVFITTYEGKHNHEMPVKKAS